MTRKSKNLFSIVILESPYWGTEQCGPCLSTEHQSDLPGETGNPWTASACSGHLSLTTACQGYIWKSHQVKVISENSILHLCITLDQGYIWKFNVTWCQGYIWKVSHIMSRIYLKSQCHMMSRLISSCFSKSKVCNHLFSSF